MCQYFFNFTTCSFLRKSRQQKQANNLNKTYMNINYKSMQEASPYEAPTVKTLDILSEGVLCSSFTGGSIDDATEEDWETL